MNTFLYVRYDMDIQKWRLQSFGKFHVKISAVSLYKTGTRIGQVYIYSFNEFLCLSYTHMHRSFYVICSNNRCSLWALQQPYCDLRKKCKIYNVTARGACGYRCAAHRRRQRNLGIINPLNAELNPICHFLALLVVHFLHVSRIRVKSLTLRLLMSYIYGAPILDVSRSHTTTQHSR